MTAPGVNGLPRLVYLGRILQLCFFPVFAVGLGIGTLVYVPQAQEALLAFSDSSAFSSQQCAFVVAFLAWVISAWYVARLLLGKRFKTDTIGPCRSAAFASTVATQLPRGLALLASLPIVSLLLSTDGLRNLGLLTAIAAVLMLSLIVFRRPLGRRWGHSWVRRWERRPHEDFEQFDSIGASGWIFIGLLSAITLSLFILLPLGLEKVGRFLGSPALLLFALMSWTILAGFGLTYLPKSMGLPSMAWTVLLLSSLVFWRWNENHRVAPVVPGVSNPARPTLNELFVRFLRARSDASAPVVFIASAGGASRAGYWTTTSLGRFEDEARSGQLAHRFSENIFAISGVSGGSLGATAFLTSVDLVRHGQSACTAVRDTANGFTGRDHLATLVGFMLFPDLFQRFWPWPVAAWDRSRALEEVWARDWQAVVADCHASTDPAQNPWRQPFAALNRDRFGANWLPALALNSSAIGAGWPVLEANFRMPGMAAFDILDPDLATGSLTLAQAVHNSARFAYASPAGEVMNAKTGLWDRLGDGGYIEASGTLTIGAMIEQLKRAQLIAEDDSSIACPPHPEDGEAFVDHQDCRIGTDRVKVVILDNTPSDPTDWLCNAAADTERAGAPSLISAAANDAGNEVLPIPDLVAPVEGSFSARAGRGGIAEYELLRMTGDCSGGNFAELRFPKPTSGRPPSIDWMLDAESRRLMDTAMSAPPPNSNLAANVSLIREWLGAK